MKILLNIAYDGKNYCGWQVQKNGKSVQGELCRAAREIYGCDVKITGCSRTDSGVHALDYYCTLETPKGAPSVPVEKLPIAFNVKLNEDITVKSAKAVADSFHARYNVKYKTYEYRIENGVFRNPFTAAYALHFPKPLDDRLMNVAARELVGTYDFSAFMASGSSVSDTVRTVKRAEVIRKGDCVIFRVTANGFLYNMVRIMVGTLIDVSLGKIKPNQIKDIILSGDRKKAGKTVSPVGLYLKKVKY